MVIGQLSEQARTAAFLPSSIVRSHPWVGFYCKQHSVFPRLKICPPQVFLLWFSSLFRLLQESWLSMNFVLNARDG
jgi:hypothetical protein